MRLLIIILILIIVLLITPLLKNVEGMNDKSNNKSIKILYLIIYNENVPYEVEMKKSLEKYVHNFDNIDTYFICFKKLNKPYEINNNVLYLNGTENFIPGILDKTIKSLHILARRYNYDYVIRGNISTVINLSKLTNLLSKNATSNIYGSGLMIPIDSDNKDSKYYKSNFASGTNIILDKTALNYLLENSNKIDYTIIDDVAIGVLMHSNKGVNYLSLPGFVYNIDEHNLNNAIFFRNRTENRSNDAKTIDLIVNHLIKQQ